MSDRSPPVFLELPHVPRSYLDLELPESAERGVVQTPGICGGSARIANTRIPVWTLVEMKKMGMANAEILQAFPTLSEVDLGAAWEYYTIHTAEIDRDIEEQDEDP